MTNDNIAITRHRVHALAALNRCTGMENPELIKEIRRTFSTAQLLLGDLLLGAVNMAVLTEHLSEKNSSKKIETSNEESFALVRRRITEHIARLEEWASNGISAEEQAAVNLHSSGLPAAVTMLETTMKRDSETIGLLMDSFDRDELASGLMVMNNILIQIIAEFSSATMEDTSEAIRNRIIKQG